MTQPRNVMMLIGEDTGRHLGCYGDAVARTPTLDALAADGARFTQAFSHAPVCAPSRGALVSGMEPWSLGVHQMRSTLLNPPRMFTHELVDAGFNVQWPTKLDFNFEPTDGWCTGRDVWWETGLPSDQPFFVYRNLEVTHESKMWSDEPAEATLQRLGRSPTDPASVKVPPYLPDLPAVRMQIARYFNNLIVQDELARQCLAALRDSGQYDNTLIIYLTDHGRGLPREKRWCYEAGTHLPLIMRLPGLLDPGSVHDELVSWIDIAPTILSLLGQAVPGNIQGRVFLGDGVNTPARTHHFAGRDRMDEAFDCQRTCRSATHLYVRNYFPELPFAKRNWYMEQAPAVQAMRDAWADGKLNGAELLWFAKTKPEEELFDVRSDPHCVNNLAGEASSAEMLSELRQTLGVHLKEVGDWGAVPETEMVHRGLLADRIADYESRLAELEPRHRVSDVPSSVLMHRPRGDEDVAPR